MNDGLNNTANRVFITHSNGLVSAPNLLSTGKIGIISSTTNLDESPSVYMAKNGSDNLILSDPVTGTKTLAELNTVTGDKLASDLIQRVTVSDSGIDWSTGAIYIKTMTGDTIFTFSNLKLNKRITLLLSGNYTPTFPAYCKKISGIYDGTTTNYIQLHCTNAGYGNEEVWCSVSKELT